ncbi:MAG: hypothetical protein D6762_08715 [Candidatus Neomarinimicrobiota bacterium]|nr:MAG: hypothetical protein D6762_08715 [Candidatus Neomarinimicrobiota bacterium]
METHRMKTKLLFTVLGLTGILLWQCSEPNYPDNIYDPNEQGLPDPVITSVSPADSAFSGIGIITITGQHFSSDPEKNLVYFNGNRGSLQSATETELVVQAPNLVADSVKIQVAVIGAYNFAEFDHYKLYPPVVEWGNFDHFFALYAMAMDSLENLYVSHSDDRDILRVFPNGERDPNPYGTHSFLKADAMRMGPAGELYIARRYKSIYKVPAGGGAASSWKNLPGNVKAYDLDFDQYGNLYTGGRKNELYRINVLNGESSFATVATYPTDVHVNAIRVFDGYVYIIGDYIGTDTTVIQDGIWRNEIQDATTLGPTELVIDWGSAMGGSDAPILNGITFAEDGTMILACDNVAALYSIDPPYTGQPITPIYTEVLDPPATKITWGNGNYLYVNSRSSDDTKKRIFRVDMVKQGAPYYGRSL